MIDPKLRPFRDAFGEPTFSGDRFLIYHADAVDLLGRMPPSLVDLTVTSPPYNIGKQYEHDLELNDYLDWCERWLALVYDTTAPTGALWLNVGYLKVPSKAKALPIPYLLWNRIAFFLVQEVVWHYGAGVASRRSFSPRNEKFLWYVKDEHEYAFNLDDVRDPNVKYPNQRKNGRLKCNPKGKNPTDVWQFPKVTSGRDRSAKERTAHPAQFPAAVIDRIIKACSQPGDVVFDPFMGSGTTIDVALRNDRYAIGVEIRDDYTQIARNRLECMLDELRRKEAQLELVVDGVDREQFPIVDASRQMGLLARGRLLSDPV